MTYNGKIGYLRLRALVVAPRVSLLPAECRLTEPFN